MSNQSFTASVWTNSSQNNNTGAIFGIRIKPDDRDKFFEKNSKIVYLIIEKQKIKIEITDTFWTTCNELRSRDIGVWLIKHELNRWEFGHPPQVCLTPKENNTFELSLPE